MSDTAGVACLTCRRHGPIVGDFGYLGMPATEPLQSCEVSGGDDSPSFGYLYEGLEPMGLTRFDLDSLAEWLREHAGHRFGLDLAGSNSEMVEMEEDEEVGEAADALWESVAARLKDAVARGTYVQARHQVVCGECEATLTSNDLEPFRSFPPYELGEAAAAKFLQRWNHPDAESWCYRVGGAVDLLGEYMPDLIRFIGEHASHGVRVELMSSREHR